MSEISQDLASIILQRFDAIDKRFDEMENRFDVMENRFDVMENRFDVMENRFDVLENRFDVMENRFDVMENRFDVMENNIVEIQAELSGQGSRLRKVEIELENGVRKITGLIIENQKDIISHQREIDKKLGTYEDLKDRVAVLEHAMYKYADEVDEIKEKLAMC